MSRERTRLQGLSSAVCAYMPPSQAGGGSGHRGLAVRQRGLWTVGTMELGAEAPSQWNKATQRQPGFSMGKREPMVPRFSDSPTWKRS